MVLFSVVDTPIATPINSTKHNFLLKNFKVDVMVYKTTLHSNDFADFDWPEISTIFYSYTNKFVT